MFASIRRGVRRRGRRAVVLGAVVLVGATVTAAHSSVADDHMGEALAMCVAVLAGGAAAAALPSLGRWLPRPPRPVHATCPALEFAAIGATPILARGDPVFLQVLRR
jgi:hypothetical protein